MKKVLFTATVDSHILQFHLPYLKLFKEKGYEVHVATNGTEEIPYCDIKHVVNFERNPLKINNLKAIKQLKKIINKEKFDIIHTHTPMGSVVTRLAAKKARKKFHTRVIYTAHGFHFFKGAPLKNWFIFYPVEKYLSKYTDTLILINQEDYNLAKKKFKKRCRDIEYVPGVGIDEKKFSVVIKKNDKDNLRKKFGLKKDYYILTCVARLDKNKNQIFLINLLEKIINKYDKIHLLLVGPDELDGFYQSVVKQKKLNNNIHFLGKREDISEILSITNIVVSSSLREGLPVNVLEAIFARKPTIAIENRGTRSLINSKNGFIVKSDDYENFIKCIEIIYNKNFTFNDNESKKKYSLRNILSELEKIYFGG